MIAPYLFIPSFKANIYHNAEQPKVTQSEIRSKETAGKPDRALDILKALDKLAARCAKQSLNPDEP